MHFGSPPRAPGTLFQRVRYQHNIRSAPARAGSGCNARTGFSGMQSPDSLLKSIVRCSVSPNGSNRPARTLTGVPCAELTAHTLDPAEQPPF